MDKLKNPIFINNCTDPLNGKMVKEIRVLKHMKDTQFKTDRIKYDMVWQYYRDRNRTAVIDVYKKYKGKELKIIYSGDPVIHDFIYQ
jgi:hypothetical protein